MHLPNDAEHVPPLCMSRGRMNMGFSIYTPALAQGCHKLHSHLELSMCMNPPMNVFTGVRLALQFDHVSTHASIPHYSAKSNAAGGCLPPLLPLSNNTAARGRTGISANLTVRQRTRFGRHLRVLIGCVSGGCARYSAHVGKAGHLLKPCLLFCLRLRRRSRL